MENIKVKVNEASINIEETIKKYIETNKPKLYILTPCYGGTCYVNYTSSLLKTFQLFEHFKFPLQIEFCKNDSLVSRARNNLVAKAMSDPQMTHIMFIVSDITWDAMDIIKLVLSEKPLIGGIYPLKNYYWNKLSPSSTTESSSSNQVQKWVDRKNQNGFLKNISDTDIIQYNMVKYNINYKSTHLKIEDNLCEVKHLATGFMMIRRHTVQKMCLAFPSTKYVDDVSYLSGSENDFAYALFDCGVEDGHYYSEDWLFCHRWSKMGGKIYVDVSISLTHTGVEDYKGCFIASMI
jgi:hypothetical protein